MIFGVRFAQSYKDISKFYDRAILNRFGRWVSIKNNCRHLSYFWLFLGVFFSCLQRIFFEKSSENVPNDTEKTKFTLNPVIQREVPPIFLFFNSICNNFYFFQLKLHYGHVSWLDIGNIIYPPPLLMAPLYSIVSILSLMNFSLISFPNFSPL